MIFKGYAGHFVYDEDRDLFEGRVENIDDLIIFQGRSMESLQFAFRDAINEHIDWCKKMSREREKPTRRPKL